MKKKIGAAWKKQKKSDGEVFLSVKLEDMRGEIPAVMFQNKKKENDSQPDWIIYLSEERQEERRVVDAYDPLGPTPSPTGYDPSVSPFPPTDEPSIDYGAPASDDPLFPQG